MRSSLHSKTERVRVPSIFAVFSDVGVDLTPDVGITPGDHRAEGVLHRAE